MYHNPSIALGFPIVSMRRSSEENLDVPRQLISRLKDLLSVTNQSCFLQDPSEIETTRAEILALLHHGGDVNYVDKEGNVALALAVKCKDVQLTHDLLRAGAVPSMPCTCLSLSGLHCALRMCFKQALHSPDNPSLLILRDILLPHWDYPHDEDITDLIFSSLQILCRNELFKMARPIIFQELLNNTKGLFTPSAKTRQRLHSIIEHCLINFELTSVKVILMFWKISRQDFKHILTYSSNRHQIFFYYNFANRSDNNFLDVNFAHYNLDGVVTRSVTLDKYVEFYEWLGCYFSFINLEDMCRTVCLKAIKGSPIEAVEHLGLPVLLKNYLLFSDLQYINR